MPTNSQTIQAFYSSFKNLDAEGMKKCYHTDIHFSDPVFPSLKGKEAGAMWAMLIESLKKGNGKWQLEFSNILASETEGSALWEAQYTFSATGRPVHNKIKASFQFKEGLIIRHIDEFDFYRWSKMAFGFTGMLIGWTPFFKGKVQSRVKGLLARYLSTH